MNEHRDYSDRFTIDFEEIDSGLYSKITSDVVTAFKLEVAGKKNSGLDEVFQNFKKGNEVVGLEWDNWSGYIVTAKTKSAESLVREIASYINTKINSYPVGQLDRQKRRFAFASLCFCRHVTQAMAPLRGAIGSNKECTA